MSIVSAANYTRSRVSKPCGLRVRTLYIGGGTPTSLSAAQLRRLMRQMADCFPLDGIEEYTVEAGRPDCTDEEKLRVLKEYGATRISIKPQTFSDAVLKNIGRRTHRAGYPKLLPHRARRRP